MALLLFLNQRCHQVMLNLPVLMKGIGGIKALALADPVVRRRTCDRECATTWNVLLGSIFVISDRAT